jgi:hypothetical protein
MEAVAGNQVEDADPAVVPLRKIKGPIIRSHGHAEENTVRVGVGRFESRWNLNDPGLGTVQLGDNGGRKRMGAAVGGDQSVAVRTERQPVRVRGNLNVAAQRSYQAAVGKNCFPIEINLDGTLVGRRAKLETAPLSGLTRLEQRVLRD